MAAATLDAPAGQSRPRPAFRGDPRPATSPGAPQGIHVAWSGSAAARLSAALLAAPTTGAASAPLTLATHLPASADTTIPVPPELTGQPFDVQLLTLRDGQTLGESSAPVTPAPAK